MMETTATERFTQRPPGMQAALVRKMEELGIRPSTYAQTISTIISREYVENVEGGARYNVLLLRKKQSRMSIRKK